MTDATTTEEVQVNENVEVPKNDEQLVQITPDQEKHIKEALLAKLTQEYHIFIRALQQLHAHPEMVRFSLQYFDTGFLWMKEAILSLPPLMTKVVTPPVSEAPEATQEANEVAPAA